VKRGVWIFFKLWPSFSKTVSKFTKYCAKKQNGLHKFSQSVLELFLSLRGFVQHT
jgi:hypothetical protein